MDINMEENCRVLQDMMSKGESSMKFMPRAVYFFGCSGSGKSTCANYFAGRSLYVKKQKVLQRE